MQLKNYSTALQTLLPTINALDCTREKFDSIVAEDVSISVVQSLPDQATFQIPGGDSAFAKSPTNLPALCAVQLYVEQQDTNSSFNFALFLPTEWNQRFLAVGNGGFAGSISWSDMAVGARYGFASMSTNTGHNSSALNATWAYNNSEALVNWGGRAMHTSVTLAKQIIQDYYGVNVTYSYYSGCSAGGKQGLKEAQEYPDDFDGIVAGAPAWWTTHLQLWNMKVGLYNLPTTAEYHIPSTLFPVIAAEVLKQCDPQDGLVDGIISDPRRCNFNPEALLCGANVTNQTEARCLAPPQLATLYKLHNDWVEANQTFIFPHFEYGSEGEWADLVGGDEPSALGTDYVKYMLGLGPDWRWEDFTPDIIRLSDQINPGGATADNFDLEPFYRKGGKLLHYHGLVDASIATGSSVYFYNQVQRSLKPRGIELDEFYRFFLVPGMEHCANTPSTQNAPWYFAGANQASALGTSAYSVPGYSNARHDVLLAMMAWVENGTAPAQIVATKYENDTTHDTIMRQRPLCMYPEQAVYKGEGDVDQAASWECKMLY